MQISFKDAEASGKLIHYKERDKKLYVAYWDAIEEIASGSRRAALRAHFLRPMNVYAVEVFPSGRSEAGHHYLFWSESGDVLTIHTMVSTPLALV